MSQVCSNLENPSGVCLAIKCSKLQNSRESHDNSRESHDKVQCDISATLRARRKTRAHLFCVNSALRCIPRETRGSPDRATRLAAFLEAITAGAAAGMTDHDRWLLARRRLEGKVKGRRSSSKLPTLVEFMLARPIASAGMIAAALGVTPRGAQEMVATIGLREVP